MRNDKEPTKSDGATAPRKRGRPRGTGGTKGGGRPAAKTYAERYAEDPEGMTTIALLLSNATLAAVERQAKAEGISVQAWIRARLNETGELLLGIERTEETFAIRFPKGKGGEEE